MNRLGFRIVVTLGVLLAQDARSVSPPETQPLRPMDGPRQPVDPALEAWIAAHSARPNLLRDKSALEASQSLFKDDPIVRAYLDLRRNTRLRDATAEKDVFALVEQELKSMDRKAPHALTAHLIDAWLGEAEDAARSPGGSKRWHDALDAVGASSCPRVRRWTRRAEDLASQSKLDLLSTLRSELGTGFSQASQRKVLEGMAGKLPASQRRVLPDTVRRAMLEHGSLRKKYPWIADRTQGQGALDERETEIELHEAERLADRRQCPAAETALGRRLEASSAGGARLHLERVLDAVKEVGNCFRRRGARQRMELWERFVAVLGRVYGFEGEAAARHRIAVLLWTQDQNDEAQRRLEAGLKAARDKKDSIAEGRNLFTLGRVYADTGQRDLAKASLQEYVEKFGEGDEIERATVLLTLMWAEDGKEAEIASLLDRSIARETLRDADERSYGLLAFALFWRGRQEIMAGRVDEGVAFFERLAGEYYSTYYGAVAHYLLERRYNAPLMLEPSRTAPFDWDRLLVDLSPAGRQNAEAAAWLLRLGQDEEARCEIAQMDDRDEGAPQAAVVKAILLHASGRWLESIQSFSRAPRNQRQSLPVGFERVLFPRAFHDSVVRYASRLGVDPDLIHAIVRQESVFNPRALSGAGARGLMQLMPQTARMESRRLDRNYLEGEERKVAMRAGQEAGKLFEAEPNLMIGIHHVRSLLRQLGDPVHVLSSYNANPAVARTWMRELGTDDSFSFIERIPYAETRSYVKLVLRNYFYYKRWYDTPGQSLAYFDSLLSPVLRNLVAQAPAETPQGPAEPAH